MKKLTKPFMIFILTLLLSAGISVAAFASEAETTIASAEAADAVTEASIKENAADLIVDLDTAENADELAAMVNKGYILAYSDGSLRPGRSYTRLELAEFVTAICSLEAKTDALPAFYDTEIFGSEAIEAAVSNGLMTGRSATAFDPYGTVLKAELLSTLEKAATLLKVDGFDELIAAEPDWAADYTICTAAEAMHLAYILDTAVTEARDNALKEAAALLAAMNASEGTDIELIYQPNESEDTAELPVTDAAAESDVPTAVGEAVDEAENDTAEGPEAAQTQGSDAAPAASTEASESAGSEPANNASSEPSSEASSEPAATESAATTKPAGVSTPADTQTTAPQTPAATAQPAASETTELSGQQVIIQQVKEVYNGIRDSIVDFFSGLFG